jgi:HD-like signal output (HDOD) protein
MLASDLSAGRIDLPSFPDVALRVRKALQDDDVSADTITRIVGVEPVLAGRLLQVANAAAVNVCSKRVTDLRAAVARAGFDLVRGSAVAFAMSQLTRAEALAGILHGVVKLYILVKAVEDPTLFSDTDACARIEQLWHANVAKALLENWDMAEDVVAAVHQHEDLEYAHEVGLI